MATINYIGLTGIKSSVTVTLGTDTFDTLITEIAGDEGLPTDYYSVSLANDPNKIDITNTKTQFNSFTGPDFSASAFSVIFNPHYFLRLFFNLYFY